MHQSKALQSKPTAIVHAQDKLPGHYFDTRFGYQAVKILPGEYFATREDLMIVTVLGSCVSVCLRDPKLNIGGMNHFLLPSDNSGLSGPFEVSARYGMYAMEMLINDMLKLGAERSRLEAKVFGAGNVLKQVKYINVGQKNADFALEYLHNEKIPVLARDLLDIYPRKVFFFPSSGKVLVKKIKELHNDTLLEREMAYRTKLKNSVTAPDPDLFLE